MASYNNRKSFMHFCRSPEASLSLPPELLLHIFAHLPHESVGSLLLVCRDWNALVSCPGSWTVWREWTRQTAAPEVYEAALAKEQSGRKVTPCWRSLYVARESSRFLRRRQEQRKQEEEAARIEKEKQLREQEQLMMAQIAYTSMALSNEKKAWKQMLTVVSISSLTTFAFFASMSLAY